MRVRTTETNLDNGIAVRDAYRLNGRLHRDPSEGPAFVLRDEYDGSVIFLEYRWHGRLHRVGAPAFILYVGRFRSGTQAIREEYYVSGRLHRDPAEGPAVIERNGATGTVVDEAYYVKNALHRDPTDGPAEIYRNDLTGRITNASYYVNGKLHRDPAEGPAVTKWDDVTGEVTVEEYRVEGEIVTAPARPAKGRRDPGPSSDPKR
ncbi:hypothetical protein HNR60_003299 [Rhodopseudomonas rhenobacensis]|uniref:MORN repeat variant n=1 Tax=Rhodopseudomonas rhenobacensis TaxID=87461 RepID=A0A7W7Z5R6_9BRAD|nr:hypothetical protein [Rhodopseudomonas rhenobacensis]MBB5048532.1 hypothetical protein [Rhodopseudomonas rhenobacensis]